MLRQPTHTERFLILQIRSQAECDLQLFVFGKASGRLIARARGVKKFNSKQAALFQPFNEIDALLIKKPESTFALLAQPKLVTSFADLIQEPEKMKWGYWVLEILNRIPPLGLSDPELYKNSLALLQNIKVTKDIYADVWKFLQWLLPHLGYAANQPLSGLSETVRLALQAKNKRQDYKPLIDQVIPFLESSTEHQFNSLRIF